MTAEEIKIYIELGGAVLFTIAMIILIIKISIKKIDKNKNGKIESEEIDDADIEFMKEMLKESITTIASGMLKLNGIKGKQGYDILLKQVKESKAIFEEIEKNEGGDQK